MVFDEGFFPARDTRTAAQQPSTAPPIQVCPAFPSPKSNLHSIPTVPPILAPPSQDPSSLPLLDSPSNSILLGPPIPPTPAHSTSQSPLPFPLHMSPNSTSPLSPSHTDTAQELDFNSTSLANHMQPNAPHGLPSPSSPGPSSTRASTPHP